MVGKACGFDGVRPGTYCEPRMTTVGSQDTTGPMTMNLKNWHVLVFQQILLCNHFAILQHIQSRLTLKLNTAWPDFIMNRCITKAGDGIIHLDE